MAIPALALRYTDEQYASKSEVSKSLGTSMVDALWDQIQAYRQQFSRLLSIQTIDKHYFYIVITPVMLERVSSIERQLMKALGTMSQAGSIQRIHPELLSLFIPLTRTLATRYQLNMQPGDEQYLINHESSLAPSTALTRYLTALQLIAHRRQTLIDEELFGDLLMTLYGHDQFASFYRIKETLNQPRQLVAKIYQEAPIVLIEPLVATLISTIKQMTLSPIIVATIALYNLLYIKPFDAFNEEIAALVFKNILIHAGYESIATYLDIESIIFDPTLESVMLEVQKTQDITYLLDVVLTRIQKSVTSLLDALVGITKESLLNEQKLLSRSTEPTSVQPMIQSHARPFSTDSSMMSEVDANHYQEWLLLTHPDMKSLTAYFYARHRMTGQFYTIALFKQKTGCAYETARTSMEHLVKLGYYRKEPYKNKFVYTAITKGDETDVH
jgi:hypothetical protein